MKTPKGRTLLYREDAEKIEFVIVAADGRASYICSNRKDGSYTVEPGETTVERVLAQGFSEKIPVGRMQLFLFIKGQVDWNAPLYT
jgi:hypothetical protein